MSEFWSWIVTNKAAVIAGVVLALKWIYNALPAPGQPFELSAFIRLLLGEIVQEAPSNEQKVAMRAPHA